MERPNWAPTEVDLEKPSVARVWDYFLGGSHNFAADRIFAEKIINLMPDMPRIAQAHRSFLRRAVRHLAMAGVRQFLDLGSGIPTVGNVHEIAQDIAPDTRVVYVDLDPITVAHSRAILKSQSNTVFVAGDLHHPATIIGDPDTRRLIDFKEPVAILLISVLHFFDDSQRPTDLVTAYTDAVVAGSYLVISHAGVDRQLTSGEEAAHALYHRSPSPLTLRTSEQVRALFCGLPLIEPGLTPIAQWRPDPGIGSCFVTGFDDCPGFCGIGRKG